MKVYQLFGLEMYTVAYSKEDAVWFFILNSIGVTQDNVVETNLHPNGEFLGKVFNDLTVLL